MGASFITETFNTVKKTEIKKQFKQIVKACIKEFGTNSYNGTFSTMEGLEISDKVFYTEDAAEDYISTHTKKWGNALAVTIKPDNKESYTLVGGWAAE